MYNPILGVDLGNYLGHYQIILSKLLIGFRNLTVLLAKQNRPVVDYLKTKLDCINCYVAVVKTTNKQWTMKIIIKNQNKFRKTGAEFNLGLAYPAS